VRNLCALRGLDAIAGAGLASAIGDPSRFASAPDVMAYLGMVPSEHSTGSKRRIGAITKAGDVHARTLLIEAAHSYRFPARVSRYKLAAVDGVPEAVRAIAWKAQTRLCQRYRHMMAKGKLKQVVVTAIARELAGFVWAIACITSDPPTKCSAVTTAPEEGLLDWAHRPHPRATPPAAERRAAPRGSNDELNGQTGGAAPAEGSMAR
jgi:transposase